MKGNPAVIGSLLTAAEMEAKLATQYHLDKRDLRFQSLKKLAKTISGFGEDCECLLKEITDQAFQRGASPVKYSAGDAVEKPSVTAILQDALTAENAIDTAFNNFYLVAAEKKDADTRNLFEHWIKLHEHEHIEWLEEQLSQIEKFTEPEYLKIQLAME
jgi:bacterioferritin (cytochrome b1)